MGKSLKLRFSRVISSFHSSCRSKDPSSLPRVPIPSTKLIPVDTFSKSYNQRHAMSEFKWRKDDKFHVVANICDDVPPPPPPPPPTRQKISETEIKLALPQPPTPPRISIEKQKKKKKKKGNVRNTTTKAKVLRLRVSSSSADDDSGMFSSEPNWDEILDYTNNDEEEEEETDNLISSSRSFGLSSDDSSTDFNNSTQLETICETNTIKRRHKRNKRRSVKHFSRRSFSSSMGRRSSVSTSSDSELPARLSVFKKLIPCSVDGKVKESFAVVKKSEDPYEDFKRSMMEMIMEKQMFEKNELEQLLQCFLSLNGKHYHGVIVEAFSHIWETLFLRNSNNNNNVDRGRRLSTHPHPRPVWQL